jgi:hypothetical protein
MLSKIFGEKSDHPLAELKSVQGLLDDLPRNDVYKLLAEITEWLEALIGQANFKVDHQFAVLRLLDEAAQPHVKKLAREYFTPHELSKFQENRMWSALENLARVTAQAYADVLRRYRSDDKGSSALKAQLPLLLAHTINALVAQLKWVCARYGAVDPVIWKTLASAYSYADQQKCLDTPVNLAPGTLETTTVKGQAARLLGWYGCGVNAMSPLFIHLAERIVTHFGASVDMHVQPAAGDFLYFDLEQAEAPKRLSEPLAAQPMLRFISMTAVQPQLEALLKVLEKNVLPDNLNLGGVYEAAVVSEVVQSLLVFLKDPPLRANPRRKVKVNLTVVGGFENFVDFISAGLNLEAAKPVQWELEDISANGFLTLLPPDGISDLRIGSLLGVQPAGVSVWGAALVRRMSRDADNRLHLGVEILANQVVCAALSQSGAATGYFEEGQLALWLYDKQPSPAGEVRLLLAADVFSMARSLQTEVDEKSYLLIPAGLLEKGTDYDLARFRVVEQEGVHHEESY